MKSQFMLDTNAVSYALRGTETHLNEKLKSVAMSQLCISAVTEAELLYGLAKCGNPTELERLVHEFLIRVEVLPWDSTAASAYAVLRNKLEGAGLSLGNLDLLIAAHSLSVGAILVTHDQAFFKAEQFLHLVDWV